jgi:hypothetical protein
MNQQETAIAMRHNSQIDDAWVLYVHFIKEGLAPEAALDKARIAIAVFKEWADSEYLEIPVEAKKELFSVPIAPIAEALKELRPLFQPSQTVYGTPAPPAATGDQNVTAPTEPSGQ